MELLFVFALFAVAAASPRVTDLDLSKFHGIILFENSNEPECYCEFENRCSKTKNEFQQPHRRKQQIPN